MGVLHETGHALYEQNLPQEWAHWPLGKARGMAMHESQSLFVEKQLGRNPAFWNGRCRWSKGISAKRWAMDDILPHVHHVERGLIRVDADEVTYPLHVILRFELEQELVAGRLEAADIPEAWDAKMRDYLGLSTDRQLRRRPDAGRALAGRRLRLFPLLHAGRHDGGAAMGGARNASIPRRRGRHSPRASSTRSTTWRRDKIWSQASRWSTPELLERATGEKLNAAHFTAHLRKRYGR